MEADTIPSLLDLLTWPPERCLRERLRQCKDRLDVVFAHHVKACNPAKVLGVSMRILGLRKKAVQSHGSEALRGTVQIVKIVTLLKNQRLV